jgi:predicted nucleic acid-binding protein
VISALDSSVILDVIIDDPKHAKASVEVLQRALSEGSLIISECVLAEIRPAFANDEGFDRFLRDWQIEFVPSTREIAVQAGRLFRNYLDRGGKRGRIVVDFLIGAHAATLADRFVARDRGYLRNYFRTLSVMVPV